MGHAICSRTSDVAESVIFPLASLRSDAIARGGDAPRCVVRRRLVPRPGGGGGGPRKGCKKTLPLLLRILPPACVAGSHTENSPAAERGRELLTHYSRRAFVAALVNLGDWSPLRSPRPSLRHGRRSAKSRGAPRPPPGQVGGVPHS